MGECDDGNPCTDDSCSFPARLYAREDGSLLEHYTFGSRREVDDWQATFAAEQRAMVRDGFGADVQREVHVAVLRGAS